MPGETCCSGFHPYYIPELAELELSSGNSGQILPPPPAGKLGYCTRDHRDLATDVRLGLLKLRDLRIDLFQLALEELDLVPRGQLVTLPRLDEVRDLGQRQPDKLPLPDQLKPRDR